MKTRVFICIVLSLLMLPVITGCTSAAVSPAAGTGSITAAETTASSPVAEITPTGEAPDELPATSTATVPALPPEENAPNVTMATGGTEPGQYIASVFPIMDRHNTSRGMYENAVMTHGNAMAAIIGSGGDIDDDDLLAEQTAYLDALLTVQVRIESELDDTEALEPPAEAAGFHITLHNAIAGAQSAIANLIAYQDEVIAKGAGDDTLFFSGTEEWDESTTLWWEQAWPAFQSLTAGP